MKLLDQVRHAARVKHFAYRSEQAYVARGLGRVEMPEGSFRTCGAAAARGPVLPARRPWRLVLRSVFRPPSRRKRRCRDLGRSPTSLFGTFRPGRLTAQPHRRGRKRPREPRLTNGAELAPNFALSVRAGCHAFARQCGKLAPAAVSFHRFIVRTFSNVRNCEKTPGM